MKTKSMIWLVVVMLLTFQLSSCSEHIDDEWHGNITEAPKWSDESCFDLVRSIQTDLMVPGIGI